MADGAVVATLDHGHMIVNGEDRGQALIQGVAFSGDGTLAASAVNDGSVRLWRVSDSTEIWRRFPRDGSNRPSVAFSPDASLIVSGGDMPLIWRSEGHEVVAALRAPQYTEAVAFSPDGTRVATGSWDGFARLWSASDGALLATFDHNEEIGTLVNAVAFSPDGGSS